MVLPVAVAQPPHSAMRSKAFNRAVDGPTVPVLTYAPWSVPPHIHAPSWAGGTGGTLGQYAGSSAEEVPAKLRSFWTVLTMATARSDQAVTWGPC